MKMLTSNEVICKHYVFVNLLRFVCATKHATCTYSLLYSFIIEGNIKIVKTVLVNITHRIAECCEVVSVQRNIMVCVGQA